MAAILWVCLVLLVILGSLGFHLISLRTHLFLSLARLQCSLWVTQCMRLTE